MERDIPDILYDRKRKSIVRPVHLGMSTMHESLSADDVLEFRDDLLAILNNHKEVVDTVFNTVEVSEDIENQSLHVVYKESPISLSIEVYVEDIVSGTMLRDLRQVLDQRLPEYESIFEDFIAVSDGTDIVFRKDGEDSARINITFDTDLEETINLRSMVEHLSNKLTEGSIPDLDTYLHDMNLILTGDKLTESTIYRECEFESLSHSGSNLNRCGVIVIRDSETVFSIEITTYLNVGTNLLTLEEDILALFRGTEVQRYTVLRDCSVAQLPAEMSTVGSTLTLDDGSEFYLELYKD